MVIITNKQKKNYLQKHFWILTYFEILMTFDTLPWGCLMSIKQDYGNCCDNVIISYNNTDIVCEVKGTLSVDNKGQFFCFELSSMSKLSLSLLNDIYYFSYWIYWISNYPFPLFGTF